MSIRSLLAFAVSLSFCGAFATSVTDDPAKGVVTFDIDAGDTYTYDQSFPSNYNALVKTGAGRLVMTRPSGFARKTAKNSGVFIMAGVLEARANGAIGHYNNTRISNGAQLYLNFEDGDHAKWSPMATYISEIAGSGPDGTGAIRIGETVTSSWESFVRNEFNLTDDATVQNDSKQTIGFSSNASVKLNGHTLTLNGNGSIYFRNGVNDEGPFIDAGKRGQIVCDTAGAVCLSGSTTFIGDETATITFARASSLILDSLEHPMPWTIRIPNGIQFRVVGSSNRVHNVLGPVEYGKTCSFSGTKGCPITFSGKVKFIGTDGKDPGFSGANSGLNVYFGSSVTSYSRCADFRAEYRKGALAMCHRMTDIVNRRLPVGDLPKRPGVSVGRFFSAGGHFPQFFLWDTCFCVMWAKHFPNEDFPIKSALDNFYKFQEPSGYICREIFKDGMVAWKERHPIGLNPPLLAWAELAAYRAGVTDAERLHRVFDNLERFHAFYKRNCRRTDGLYFSTIFGCGMDDLPRWPIGMKVNQLSEGGIVLGREDLSEEYARPCWDNKNAWVYQFRLHQNWNRQAGWIDISSQMAFDCLNLAEIAEAIGANEKAAGYRAEHAEIAAAINAKCWDESRGFYFDCWEKGVIPRYHVGAFWTLIAKVAPPDRAKRMLNVLFDERIFWSKGGIASLGKNDPDYNPMHSYWNGSVWPPTMYMTILGLKAYGFTDEADRVARRWYDACARLWDIKKQIYENIQPDDPLIVRKEHMGPDWCGWSALAPLALPFEMGWD